MSKDGAYNEPSPDTDSSSSNRMGQPIGVVQADIVTIVAEGLASVVRELGSPDEQSRNSDDRILFRVALTFLVGLRTFTTKSEFQSILRFTYSLNRLERLEGICCVVWAYEVYHCKLFASVFSRLAQVPSLDEDSELSQGHLTQRLEEVRALLFLEPSLDNLDC